MTEKDHSKELNPLTTPVIVAGVIAATTGTVAGLTFDIDKASEKVTSASSSAVQEFKEGVRDFLGTNCQPQK